MSRSRRKSPFIGVTTAKSEKEDKQNANRKFRRINKEILTRKRDDTRLIHKRATSNVWSMAKDGKRYIDPKGINKELLRK